MVTGVAVYSQNLAKVDSLKEILGKSSDKARYEVLFGLAYELFDFRNEEALEYGLKAHRLARDLEIDSLIVRSGRLSGQLLRRVNRYDEAIILLEAIKPLAEKTGLNGELARILNTLAILHTLRAEYDKALECNFQSLVLREKEGKKEPIAIALMNIGFTHYKMGSFDLALDYNLQAQRAYEEAGKRENSSVLTNIGLCHNELGRFVEAKESFERALLACSPNCSDEQVMNAEYGLGNSLFLNSQIKESADHFQTSYRISVTLSDIRFQLENLVRLAKVALVQGDFGSAKAHLELVDRIPEKEDYREILKTFYRLQADYYTASNDFKKASEFLRQVNIINDSIFHADVIKNLTKVQTQYAQRENLAIIAEKDEVLALNQRLIVQQRSVNTLLGIILGLSAILGTVIYRNYRKIRQVNAELASAKGIIEDHNKFLDHLVDQKTKELVDSNEQLVKVNDELDNFIYKTSHDIRGPLASLKGMVNLAIMDVKDDKALGYLGKLDITAEKLNMILTRLLIVNRINHAELKPEPIHFEPIIQEILTLEVKKGIPAKIKIDYEVAPDVQLMSDREMVRLIFENLIDNAVKYYNDSDRVESFVRIQVGNQNGKVTARVMDNGVGISKMNREKIFQMFVRASERSDTGGIGLYLAKLATEKLGGDISLISTDEKYTEFIVQFPDTLPKPAERKAEETQRVPDRKPEPKPSKARA
jgi:signal transduction histidine kinase